MTFYIVGSGNMAWFLTKRLTEAGHICKGLFSRNATTGKALAEAFSVPVLDSLENIKDNADCCILAIADNAIKEVTAGLSFADMVLLHTAGAVDIVVLSSSSKHYGCFWLIYSIIKTDLPAQRSLPCIYEGSSDKAIGIIKEVTHSFTDIIYEADGQKRRWLHLTAVLSNNFSNHLMTIAEKICTEQQLPFELLHPIIRQTAARIMHASPYELQTGPAKRGDTITTEHHLQLLHENPVWQQLYEVINSSIAAMYRQTDK